MTTVVNPGTAEPDTVATIERIIDATLQEFVSVEAARTMAKADLDAASDKVIGRREAILVTVAGRAYSHGWDIDDIETSIEKVISKFAGNDKKKKSSLATFKSEILLATNRKVRGRVGDIFKVTREAFDRENETRAADKDAPAPIRKAFARAYHTAIAVMKATRDGANVAIATPGDVAEFAAATLKARRIDYKRVKSRLDAIRAELQAFHGDFPEDGIGMCIEYLEQISEGDLRKSREALERMNAEDEDDAPAAVATPAPEPEAEPLSDDAIADALRDMAGVEGVDYGTRAAA